MAEVTVLEGWGRESALRRKWMQMWEQLGTQILKMPLWMQEIVLEDINTAVCNRIATMEMIQKSRRRKA